VSTGHPSPVQWNVEGDLLVVTIDHPPVNALSQSVRQGLLQAVELLDGETRLGAMVLRSTGAVFVGGADIREFGGPRLDPRLNDVCDRLERVGKPVLSALQGAALGGGLEVVLASHGRVAAPGAVVAFPEVLLGLLPGAGGTQRAPRLCGAALALDLMLTGRRLTATDALAAGLIDVVDDDPVQYAVQWARQLIATPAPLRRASAGEALLDVDAQRSAIHLALRQMPDDATYRFARERIVRCVAAAVDQPYAAGAAVEAQAFLECLASPQREYLVQQFFAERAARKAERANQK
jgi:3-hydroxyacyl-CoA dehydrogenase